MNSKVIFSLLFLLLVPVQSHSLTPTISGKKVAALAAGATAAVIGYKLVRYSYALAKKYLEEKVHDKVVDTIVIALAPPSTLNALSSDKKEKALRTKAWITALRKRILSRLDEYLMHEGKVLSPAHQKTIATNLKRAQLTFTIIDIVRSTNPYGHDYDVASRLDQIIEKRIIQSLLLACKPDSECNAAELAQKKSQEENKTKIMAKLQSKVSGLVFDKIKSLFLF